MSNVLIVVAHPDDEILGVGATVAKRVAQGDKVWCIILGEGQTSRWDNRESVPDEVIQNLHKDTLAAVKCVGYEKVYFGNFPDNRFDQVDLLDIIKYIEEVIGVFLPDIVYTHHIGDLNIDHQLTFKAVLTATRTMEDCCVKEIYAFETVSSTEWDYSYTNPFSPNVFEVIDDYFFTKIEAMKHYQTELCEFPHPRSLKCLEITAQKWGSVIGANFAEAFMLIRKINA